MSLVSSSWAGLGLFAVPGRDPEKILLRQARKMFKNDNDFLPANLSVPAP